MKMRWFLIPATLTFGLNAVLAAVLLSLYSYNVAVDKSKNAPIDPNQDWMHLVRFVVPFSCCWMLFSIFGMYVCLSKKQMWTATLVLILYATAFGFAIYFVVAFGNLIEKDTVDADALFKVTLKEIEKQSQDAWVPEWLDNIQKQSKRCCGIRTYRDYEELWASDPTRVPRSCCKSPQTIQGPCPTDLTQIPFPNTPTDFFKVETGCVDEIVEAARHHARESYQNSIVMAAFIGCGLLSYLLFYTKTYLDGSMDKKSRQQRITVVTDVGDSGEYDEGQNVIDTSSGPIFITSSGEIIGSMDSVEAVHPIGSMESVMFPKQMMSAQQQPTMLGPVFSGTKVNRANVGGLQQFDQQPQQFRASQQQQKLQQQQQQQFQQIEQQNQQLLQQQQKGQKLQQQYQSPQQMQQLMQQSPQQYSLQMQQQVPPQQFQQLSSQSQQLTPQQIQQLQRQQLQQLPQSIQQDLQQQNQELQSPLDTTIAGGSFGISFAGKKGHRGRNRDMSVDDNQFSPEQITQQQTPHKHHRTGMPRTASADHLGIFMQNDQQQQDVPPGTPPGSPTERRKKKVRRDALGNRNNKL